MMRRRRKGTDRVLGILMSKLRLLYVNHELSSLSVWLMI
jgi:hypothetical protein